MINLLQETKKKVEEKNLLSRFPEFDRRSIFAAALYEELAAVPAENILKSEANIGLLGREDECECLSELFFMRAHGIIHDACGRAYCEMGVGLEATSLLATILNLESPTTSQPQANQLNQSNEDDLAQVDHITPNRELESGH